MKSTSPGQSGRRLRSGSASGTLERTQENQRLIRASMKRWQGLNRYGRSIGRGLSEAELLDKVAGETGASKTLIRDSLRRGD
ncbi:MAG TPA: hypothetical protein DEB40_02445 [Elusimicrobia bacterium]|nr:hypothetical protein [Elusimicrobiota bacterium]HBT60590.1 hypothetical protein [Elusimicrobiota bacterium]